MARRTNSVGILVVSVVVFVLAEVVRRWYFYGRFLGADDLSDEQQYRRCRRRLR